MLRKLKQMVVGTPASSVPKLLLLGPTGSGKSSFLNLLCNFDAVVKQGEMGIEHFKTFNDLSLENASERKMASKTSGATVYDVDFLGVELHVVDTPGFGDCRGMDFDNQHISKIMNTLEEVDHITMIGLVVNGRDSRMNANLKYVLSAVTSILPQDVLSNIVVVFTNTADPLDLNFDADELISFFGRPVANKICIENPYCRVEKAKAKQASLPLGAIAKSLHKSFEDTAEQLMQFFEFLNNMVPVPTLRFAELYRNKQKIERTVLDTLAEYDHQQAIDKQLRRAQRELAAAEHSQSLNANFATTRVTPKWSTESTSRHNTLCGASGCYSNCHAPCNLDKTLDKLVFRQCAAMGGGDTCKECGHSYHYHYHDEVRWTRTDEKINLVDNAMKREFENAKTMQEQARILRDGLKQRRKESESKKLELSARLLATIDQYQKISVARSYRQMLHSQKDLLVQHIDAMQGEAGTEESLKGLAAARNKLDQMLSVIEDVEQMPWQQERMNAKQWACNFMEISEDQLTSKVLKRRFKDMSMTLHPDRPGGDTPMFNKLARAMEVLQAHIS
eukprot:TRINITY_DN90189_c0_g1_i1.p1 TRINITY_DN90189_c0_g1~~TRINITY_DN90189_c0_g1_i1.p1  ORF type:complete len:562 (+),score=114.23 TRINITY_DN90189_c0_g1_i1:63-1748(+)